jgi:shikimate kinase
MKSNIALIGFMAAGKSAAGRALASKTGKTLVEVDALIEAMAGKSIKQIFAEEGEIAFREYEIAVIKELSSQKNLVLACGGGVVLNKINIDRLKQESVVIWLTASTEAILERLRTSRDTRPLMPGKSNENNVRSLLLFRQPFYESAADLQVNTSGLSIEQVVENILKKLESYAD